MSDIRLDRCNVKGALMLVCEHTPDTLQFARIPGLRTSTMGLDHVHALSGHARAPQHTFEEHGLGWGVGMRDGMCETALIDFNAPDDAKDAVILDDGVREPLKDEDPTAFAAGITVCGHIKCFTLACGAQEVASIQTEEHLTQEVLEKAQESRIASYIGTGHNVDPSHKSRVAIMVH